MTVILEPELSKVAHHDCLLRFEFRDDGVESLLPKSVVVLDGDHVELPLNLEVRTHLCKIGAGNHHFQSLAFPVGEDCRGENQCDKPHANQNGTHDWPIGESIDEPCRRTKQNRESDPDKGDCGGVEKLAHVGTLSAVMS